MTPIGMLVQLDTTIAFPEAGPFGVLGRLIRAGDFVTLQADCGTVGTARILNVWPVIDAVMDRTDEEIDQGRSFVTRSVPPVPNALWDGDDWHDLDIDVQPGQWVVTVERTT